MNKQLDLNLNNKNLYTYHIIKNTEEYKKLFKQLTNLDYQGEYKEVKEQYGLNPPASIKEYLSAFEYFDVQIKDMIATKRLIAARLLANKVPHKKIAKWCDIDMEEIDLINRYLRIQKQK